MEEKPSFVLVHNEIVHIVIDEAYEEEMDDVRKLRKPRRLL